MRPITSSRMRVELVMVMARWPNCSAEVVSLTWSRSGDTHTMREVRAVPPNESFMRRVSLLSR